MSTTLRALTVAIALLALLALLTPLVALGQPIPALSDSLLDFGEVPFPRFRTLDFVIYNTGDAQLIVTDVVADNYVKFTDDATPVGIAAGDSQVVNVTYTPGVVGFDSTTINVIYYAGTLDTLYIAARGRGVPNIPQIALSADTVFAVVPGGKVVSRDLTITNEGGGTLEWTATEIPSTTWLQLFPTSGEQDWLQTRDVEFRMSAGSNPPGHYYAAVEIASNDVDSTPLQVVVHMQVVPSPLISVTPDPIDVGVAFVGFAARRSVMVENVGVGDLHVINIVPSRPEITVNLNNLVVPQSEARPIEVTVVPPSQGAFSGTLTFFSDDIGTPQHVVAVTATAVVDPPVIIMLTDTVEVTPPWNASVERKVAIGNAGGYNLNWTRYESAPWLDVVPASGTVAPGQVDSVAVTFTGAVNTGVYTADVLFTSNDPVTPNVYLPTRMIVLPAYLIHAPDTTLTYSPRFVGLDESQTVTITNTGNVGLDISSVTTTDGNFTLGPVPTSLAPLEAADIVVTFAPQSQGLFNADLVIENNSSNNDSIVIPLHGEGLIALDLSASPDSIAVALEPGGWSDASVSITNPSHREQWVRATAFAVTPPNTRTQATAAPAPMPAFYDNFEDIDLVGWQVAGTAGARAVAAEGARSVFAYYEAGATGGHGKGIYHDLPAPVQPREVSFWVRPAQDDMFANYVTLRDGAGREVVFFFALDNGMFYVNASTGGHQSFPYQVGTWYYIEYRNMNWNTKTFDYYIDGQLVKAAVAFRNAVLVDNIRRIELYSYSAGAGAAWDNIWVDWGSAPSWLSYSPAETTLDSLGTADVQVRVSATGLEPGLHEATLALRTNNSLGGLLAIPVTLTLDSLVTGVDGGDVPAASALHQNVPNPFNPVTTIAYDLREAAGVSIVIYDVSGARVRALVSRSQPAGRYAATWDGTDDGGRRVASGVYFYRLVAGAFTQTKKMVLLK